MKKLFTILALLMAFTVNGFAQDTWTVAGSAAVFGSSWDVSDNSNNMTYDSETGKWTLKKSNVTLTEGVTYEYKVVKNHSWNNENYGADGNWIKNKTFTVDESASYDVTITFDYNNGKTLTESCVKVGAAVNAEITQVDIRGEFNGWSYSEDYQFVKGEGEIYTLSLDLSSDMEDKAFKLVVNNSDWLGYGSMTIDAPEGWIDVAEGNDFNYLLKHSVTGYKTYTLTATWLPNSSATSGWTLKIEGAEPRVAEITSVQIFGSWDNWDSDSPIDLLAFESNTYVGGIDIPSAKAEEFKLLVNGSTWLGYDKVALAENYNFVSQGSDNNFKLSEAYLSYDITATWTPSADASAGWTLTIVPGDERPKYTYTATFVNGANWENVYAYIWKVDGDNNVELNGPFPGVQLEKTGTTDINTVEYDVYTFTFETYEDESTVPEMIIFSDGTDTNKTDDLDFEEGKEYTETVPHENYYVIGSNGTEWVALGKMNYFAYMNAYDYSLDNTWTGKYFAIAPASALNADGSVAHWEKVLRPKSESGNYLVELRQYYDDVVTGGDNVWEKADDFTQISIVYYLDQQQFALYPESEVTISEAGYATYSNKYAYQISGVSDYVEVSIVTAVTTVAVMNNLTLFTEDGDTFKEYNIPAGTGVIVKGSGSFLVLPYGSNSHEEYVDVTGNMLIGSGNSTYDITGYDTSVGDYKAYILADRTNGVGFYPLASYTEDNQLAPHKAFLAVRKNQSAPDFIGFGDTTGINNVERGALNVEGCYTLDGRRVENPTKGLYIINGKKVLVK